ncbi:hypothetical protein [Embleya scabrispora]|uniref:hypothetical protein n=1 Tax=Embleya scabrispora TaxID=159449 RepID=UPI000375D694|nr:hypothetical protein [Embleya scabrispora]MYS83437.1 hypothetical protein [Streptomyces sp. SID5474]
MFKPSKKVVATFGVAMIAGTAGLVAGAPAAFAGSVNPDLRCTEPILHWNKTGKQTFDATLTPATGNAPGTVKIKIDAGENPLRPDSDFENIGFVGKYTFTLSTGGEVTVVAPEFKAKIGPNTGINPPEFTADLAIPQAAPGTQIDLTLKTFALDVNVPGLPAPTTTATCEVTGSNGVIASYKVAEAPPQDPTLTTTPGQVKPGGALTVAGTNWPAGTPTVELCDASGNACDATKVTGALTVTDGALAGTATIGATVADGSYQLKVTVGDKSKTSNVSVKADVPSNPRKLVLNPTHGPVGTEVTVAGEGYTPGADVYVIPTNAAQQPDVPGLVMAKAGTDGKFTAKVKVNKADTTLIAASEDTTGTLSAGAPFTVDGNPPAGSLKQDLTGTIAGGALTISQENGGIKLSDVTLNGTEQNMTGALNTVTVKDYRGGATGWTLTGAVTDFSNGAGGTIPAEKFSWVPKITPGEGSPSQAVAGSAGPIGKTGATLASAPNADVTGGTFKADAGLALAVPAYQAPGNYSGTLTLSIS